MNQSLNTSLARENNVEEIQYRFVYNLVETLVEMYEITTKVVFRNRELCCFRTRADTLIFSYSGVDSYFQGEDFREYYTVGRVWEECGYQIYNAHNGNRNKYYLITDTGGLQAVYCVIVHEFAHALDWAENGQASHGNSFKDCLARILDDFPYEDVMYLADVEES